MASDSYKVRRILDILREPPKVGVPALMADWLAKGVAVWNALPRTSRVKALADAYGVPLALAEKAVK